MKKYLFFSFIGIALVFTAHAQAATVYDYENLGTTPLVGGTNNLGTAAAVVSSTGNINYGWIYELQNGSCSGSFVDIQLYNSSGGNGQLGIDCTVTSSWIGDNNYYWTPETLLTGSPNVTGWIAATCGAYCYKPITDSLVDSHGFNGLKFCDTSVGCTSPTNPYPPSSIYLTTPTSTQTLQNFQNWALYVKQLSAAQIESNNTYGVGVWYSKNSSTLQNLTINQGDIQGNVLVDVGLIAYGDYNNTSTQCTIGGTNATICFQWNGGNNFYLSVPKFRRLTEGNWYAIPYLTYSPITNMTTSSISYGTPTLAAQGSMINFIINATATLPAVSTSSNLAAGLPANNTTSSALNIGFGSTVQTPVYTPASSTMSFAICLYSGVSSTFNIWNGSDWQCLIYNTLDGLIQTTRTNVSNAIVSGVTGMQSIFPLSLITNFNNDILVAARFTSSTALQDVTVGNGTPNIFGGRVYTFYSASTTRTWCQDTLHFDCRGGIGKAIYALAGLLMLGMTLGVIRTIKNQKQNA